MKLSLRATAIAAAIFAVLCGSVAVTGFMSLGDIADPAQKADARGFAWFWTFLASLAIVTGVVAWRMSRSESDDF